jgi:hypothetical protein
MIFEEAKVGSKGMKVFIAWTYSLIHLRVKLQQKQWGSKWEERDGASKGRAPFEHGGTKAKIDVRAYVCNKCST